MANLRRDPYRSLRWNDPVAIVGDDLHQSLGTIEKLSASMGMPGVDKAMRIVGSNGDYGPGRLIQHDYWHITHKDFLF
jgi:hypothetical protein